MRKLGVIRFGRYAAFLIDGKLSARERAKGIKGSSCVASIPLYGMDTVDGHRDLDWLCRNCPTIVSYLIGDCAPLLFQVEQALHIGFLHGRAS